MLQLLSEYNHWANSRICSWIREAGETVADQEVTSSFPSIRKTLYHLWDAQAIWMLRLKGESPNAWPSHSFKGNIDEATEAIIASSLEFVRFCSDLQPGDEDKQVTFRSLDGTAYHNSTAEIVLHVMNHSTYHRGQLITMLRSAGFTAVGSTDLIRYYREKGNDA
jgi:uncharacterized damage-inducible protein DinB